MKFSLTTAVLEGALTEINIMYSHACADLDSAINGKFVSRQERTQEISKAQNRRDALSVAKEAIGQLITDKKETAEELQGPSSTMAPLNVTISEELKILRSIDEGIKQLTKCIDSDNRYGDALKTTPATRY